MTIEPCASVQAAEEYLDGLTFSDDAYMMLKVAEREPRFVCSMCGRSTRLYCSNCTWTALPLPPPLKLGLQVHILLHPKESIAKSSVGQLSLLAPNDVHIHRVSGAMPEAITMPGTWLLFPRKHAVDASEVNWASVTQLVLIDSRWKHANAMAGDPLLSALPAMSLSAKPTSHFWRSKTEKLAEVDGLLSTVECLHSVMRVRAEAGFKDHVERLDDLLLFFALRLRLVMDEYAQDATKCCPWCTEAARRQAVHSGNARVASQRHSSHHIHDTGGAEGDVECGDEQTQR